MLTSKKLKINETNLKLIIATKTNTRTKICDPILENQPYRGNYDSEQ